MKNTIVSNQKTATKSIVAAAIAGLVSISSPAFAVTQLVGNVDGFGITPTTGLVRATPTHNQPADVDGDGIIEAGEFLPDWNKGGTTQVHQGDEFDMRGPAELLSVNGAENTDFSITPSGANGRTFTFQFDVPQPGAADHGVPHYINFIVGDYDIAPASLDVDGQIVPMTTQPPGQDGLVQMVYAMVPWSSMQDGIVVIRLIAPQEPYLAIDYTLLDINQIADSDGDGIPDGLEDDNAPDCTSDADCFDGNECTSDVCDAGECVNEALSCDDGIACTLDVCEPSLGCQFVNQCPDCSAAAPTIANIWPPNHKMVDVGVDGVSDPQGQPVQIDVLDIYQDEPTNTLGDGNTCGDAALGGSIAQVRAERSGTPKTPGNGRVYTIVFTATDPDGYACTGAVTTCVPHDQRNGGSCLDDGPQYDSLVCN